MSSKPENNDARLVLRRNPNGTRRNGVETESQEFQSWTTVSILLGLISTV